ncbi:metallophosphoesterase family protein [Mesonia sp. K7]|uniref:metallophosphoesterase family protein n=1 Tax=Mesonia sp. K7 TaxID=2218606 RepID=UPI000DA94B3D|nr:metallophosphoesterase family protein [Mesonia sp. K7]PZD79041.1 serine/threonine protein phosphatase [Mesonia sp. K7]
MKTFAVGDIHGGLKALKQLFESAKITTKDQFIFLGDYVDGWSDSVKTVSFLIEFQKTHRCVFLRGNHDELAYDWLRTKQDNELWFAHGGKLTQEKYLELDEKTTDEHLLFYKNLKNYHIQNNKLFVHAGFTNLHGPQHEYAPYMVYWDRTLWETALATNPKMSENDVRFPKRLKLFDEIYIGHTPTTRIGENKPTKAINVWNVDTGAAFKGQLSMIDIDSKEIFQSEPVYHFYPNENGRN